jgi:hypothetical protein
MESSILLLLLEEAVVLVPRSSFLDMTGRSHEEQQPGTEPALEACLFGNSLYWGT